MFLNDRAMKSLNKKYRGINKTTDVLSFPQLTSDYKPEFFVREKAPVFLGDIVINANYAKRQALINKSSFYYEISRLLIHGLLHLLGYDHEKNKYQKKKMSLAENKLQNLLGKF